MAVGICVYEGILNEEQGEGVGRTAMPDGIEVRVAFDSETAVFG